MMDRPIPVAPIARANHETALPVRESGALRYLIAGQYDSLSGLDRADLRRAGIGAVLAEPSVHRNSPALAAFLFAGDIEAGPDFRGRRLDGFLLNRSP